MNNQSSTAPGRVASSGTLSWLANADNVADETGIRVGVVGAGFVGLVTAVGLTQCGHTVTCVDNNAEKVQALNRGEVPLFERDLPELVSVNMKRNRLSFDTDLKGALTSHDMIMIAVGTPTGRDGLSDMTAFDNVINQLSEFVERGQIIIIKSTVPVGTARRAQDILNRRHGGDGAVPVISNPEFLRESTAVYDYFHPERIVVGGSCTDAVNRVVDLYRTGLAQPAPIVVTDNDLAELIKYASNAYLAMRLSYVNELSALCDGLGVQVGDVTYAMGLDRRIGADYLDVGPGFGGSCLPKDLDAYIAMGTRLGVTLDLAPAIRAANQRQVKRTVAKVAEAVGGSLAGKTVAALGLAFKAHTSDTRSSPAIAVIRELQAAGAGIRAFDPVAMAEAREQLPDIVYCTGAQEAATGSDALVILTEWPEFQVLDWSTIRNAMSTPTVVDARNLLTPESMRRWGFTYIGMGQR